MNKEHRQGLSFKPWQATFWVSLAYFALSDFGRSTILPFAWWLGSIFGFGWLYLRQVRTPPEERVGFIQWLAEQFAALAGGETQSLTCVVGEGDPWNSAILLSVSKGLVFFGGSSDKLHQIYACLYGTVGDGGLVPGFIPVIPDSVAALGLLQSVLSAILIFLLLLGVRNHFRIK